MKRLYDLSVDMAETGNKDAEMIQELIQLIKVYLELQSYQSNDAKILKYKIDQFKNHVYDYRLMSLIFCLSLVN
ncbi:hypothetical protein ABID56_001714 [Alkalibacillus flavidus]|uniref:Uncharacterized protein n=1 Tax=Alkalibacillus flavidus TaxID=546021 RepID=A0ABV2KYH4_9BACI